MICSKCGYAIGAGQLDVNTTSVQHIRCPTIRQPVPSETEDVKALASATGSASGLKLEVFSALEESLRYAGKEAWWIATVKARDAMEAARKLAELNDAKPTPNVGAEACAPKPNANPKG
jgi:hypothetical protein